MKATKMFIPTEKESRIIKNSINDILGLSDFPHDGKDSIYKPQQLLITSDKEITEKRQRWILDTRVEPFLVHQVSIVLDSKLCPEIIASYPQIEGTLPIEDKDVEYMVNHPDLSLIHI